MINLELAENVDINVLRSKVPKDHARYHFFAFKHTHEGDQLISNGLFCIQFHLWFICAITFKCSSVSLLLIDDSASVITLLNFSVRKACCAV